MTNDILLLLIFNALFIIGLYKIAEPGMILDFIGHWIRGRTTFQKGNKSRKFIAKPLIDCPPCMSSVWGAAGFLSIFGFSYILLLPVYVIMLAGLVTLLMRIANYEL